MSSNFISFFAPRRTTYSRLAIVTAFLSLASLVLALPTYAAPSITLGGGVANAPPNVSSTALNPQQTAIADKATLVPAVQFAAVLQATLTARRDSRTRTTGP